MKNKFPDVSYADLFQMASAAAIEAAGGPKIDMQYGRKDVTDEQGCAPDGLLPGECFFAFLQLSCCVFAHAYDMRLEAKNAGFIVCRHPFSLSWPGQARTQVSASL